MSTQLNGEILALVKEKLPSLQAEAFALFYKTAEETEKSYADLTAKYSTIIARLAAEHEQASTMIQKLEQRIWKQGELEQREEVVVAIEHERALLELKEEHCDEKVELMQDLFHVVFGNTVIHRELHRTASKDVGNFSTIEKTAEATKEE